MTTGPLHLAGDAWLVRSLPPAPDPGRLRIHTNAMVLAGEEPVLVDTGSPAGSGELWAQIGAVLDPADVRWIFLSHDDADHTGNLVEALERCPDATVVASALLAQRLAATGRALPASRCLWVEDGDRFTAGDRSLLALRPPAYDSPATRGLFDERTGVYWAADCFAAPVPHEVDEVAELDDGFWTDSFTCFHAQLSPWIADVDPIRWRRSVGRVATLGATTIASAHGPVIRGAMVGRALDLAVGLAGQPAVELAGLHPLEARPGRPPSLRSAGADLGARPAGRPPTGSGGS